MNKRETIPLEVRNLQGLQLDRTPLSRAENTWTELANFVQTEGGAIKKTLGPLLYSDVGENHPVVAVRGYKRLPSEELSLYALSMSGRLQDITHGMFAVQFPNVGIPFVGVFQGQEKDPSVAGEFLDINYLITTVGNGRPRKWNGLVIEAPTEIGVAPPPDGGYISAMWLMPKEILQFATTVNPAPDTPTLRARALPLRIGRRYTWTYYNPTTNHESSPAPVSDELLLEAGDIPASHLLTVVMLSLPANPPQFGTGYTRRKVYATHDGGAEFFLVKGLVGGDTEHSIPLNGDPIFDGTPILSGSLRAAGPGVTASPLGDYDEAIPFGTEAEILLIQPALDNPPLGPGNGFNRISQDQILVDPAPREGEHDPPPLVLFGIIYANRFWVVDASKPWRLWFSNLGDFQSFDRDNFFDFPQDDYSPVTCLTPLDRQLIVQKRNQTIRIVGTDFTNFVVTPIDNRIGASGSRAAYAREGFMSFRSPSAGLCALVDGTVVRLSEQIEPLIATLMNTNPDRTIVMSDTQRDLLIYLVQTHEHEDQLLIQDIKIDYPFSRYTPLAPFGQVFSMQEVEMPDGSYKIFLGMLDGTITELFAGAAQAGIARTQLLPQARLNSNKVFYRLRADGDVRNFNFRWRIYRNGQFGAFRPFRPLRNDNFIGETGEHIEITFTSDAIAGGEETILSNYRLEYTDVGVPR